MNNLPAVTRGRLVLSLIPRSAAEWSRSVAYPLFGCCFSLLMFAICESFGGDRDWRYTGPSIAGILLPLLGIVLAAVSCGPGLSRSFRRVGLIVAALSVLGMLLAPALAE